MKGIQPAFQIRASLPSCTSLQETLLTGSHLSSHDCDSGYCLLCGHALNLEDLKQCQSLVRDLVFLDKTLYYSHSCFKKTVSSGFVSSLINACTGPCVSTVV